MTAPLDPIARTDLVGALMAALDDQDMIDLRRDEREFTALIRSAVPVIRGFAWHRPTLEELVLGYLRATPSQLVAEVAAA